MTAPRILRAVEGRRMPWKNGGGETVEILAYPAGAGLDAFDWRISMATVAVDGPFSVFPGIDRTLAILEGDGLELAIAGRDAVRLGPASPPLAFPADAPCLGRLVAGPITDLNVMTRRTSFTHRVTRLAAADPLPAVPDGGILVLVCQAGTLRLAGGGAVLGPRDVAVLAREHEAPVTVAAMTGEAAALAVVVRPA